MSRIGKQPIILPTGVSVNVDASTCAVKGPKGELLLPLHERVRVAVEGNTVRVRVENENEKRDRALWGLFRMLIANTVEGVTKGFSKQLEIQGIGYRASLEGKQLVFNLGFSHPVKLPLPAGIDVTVEKNIITVSGIDKQLVGETAAHIRRLRPPEPYKGKGIRYVGESVRRKAGKVVKAVGAA